MLQEDTFEIIEKKSTEELPTSTEKTIESVSSRASSISVLSPTSGNIFSNVAPPLALPSFVPTIPQKDPEIKPPEPASYAQPEQFYPTQFSAAIPPSKGVQHGPPEPPNAQPDSGIIGWMKGAVDASGGIFSKVAEKARNSVESMITTLDPQMREYIYSGGDLDILVASTKPDKIGPVQEAFQGVFGKATVQGVSAQATNVAVQPVGFAAGIKAAEERIQAVFRNPRVQPMPVVAVENFLLEVGEDKWYDLGVVLLNDPARQISLQTFTQMTPVPTAVVSLAQEDTPADYPLKWSGYSVPIGALMGTQLGVSHLDWHNALTGVSRREMILSATKALATLYKTSLVLSDCA